MFSLKESFAFAKNKKLILHLYPLIKGYRSQIFLSSCFIFFGSMVDVLIVVSVGHILNLIRVQNFENLYKLLFLIIGLISMRGILVYSGTLLNMSAFVNIIAKLRQKLYESVVGFPMRFFTQVSNGEVLSKFLYDSFSLTDDLQSVPNAFLLFLPRLTMLVLVLFFVNWKASLILSFILLLTICLIQYLIKKVYVINKKLHHSIDSFCSYFCEFHELIKVIKSFLKFEDELDKFCNLNKEYSMNYMKFFKLNWLLKSTVICTFSACAIGLGFLGFFCFQLGWVNWDEILIFGVVLGSMRTSLKAITNGSESLQRIYIYLERILSYVDQSQEKKEIRGIKHLPLFKKKIALSEVSFSYDSSHASSERNEQYVLKNISFDINKGESVAIVGCSGSGKSTIINLLLGFETPSQGSISIDENDFQDISITALRKHISYVDQSIFLFNETIAFNILYSLSCATQKKDSDIESKMIQAAKSANIHDFIMQLPNQYNTIVGPNGSRLSMGQRQRITIARAFLKNAPIIIFDEPTACLDNESQKYIQDAIHKLPKDITVIIIAHSLSITQSSSKILVLDQGVIENFGTHDELIRKSKVYNYLYSMELKNDKNKS